MFQKGGENMFIHVVERGDTLWTLSRQYNVTLNQLIDINDLPDPDRLVIGQALLIPSANVHVVQPGETLWTIAARYGSTVEALAAENQLANPNLIFPGQVIRLPRPVIEVNGYLTQMGQEGRQIIGNLGPYLTYVTIFSYEIQADGSLTTLDDEPVIAEAKRQRVIPLMCITNTVEGRFESDLARDVLQSVAVQNLLIDNILNRLRTKGYGGVNVDFEYVYPEDRIAYNQFLQRLRERISPEGYSLSTALAPKTRADQPGLLYEAHDYPAHGDITNFTVLMTYEWGWAGGPPWAIAPITEVRRVLDYAVTAIDRNKILMGTPTYGRDWPLPYVAGQTRARTISYQGALQRAIRYGVDISYHPEYQAPYFQYTDEEGRQHEVWYEDARSIEAKFNTVKQYGLRGISYWEISIPFRQNWVLLENRFTIRKY
jgi:spore germination protein